MSYITLSLDAFQYLNGNVIKGRAVCNFRSSKVVRKIRISFKGMEYTHWTETESYRDSDGKDQTRTVDYTGHNDIIYKEQIVHGPGELSAGRHTFPFQFSLPDVLPDSFHHTYGKIEYLVKATVDRAWKTDFEDQKEIRIKSPIRLEQLSVGFKRPAEYSDEKTVCCFCCANGPIQMDVSLEKRAFAVGEIAAINVYIMNMSNVNVESLNTKITQELIFAVTSPSTQHKRDYELIGSDYNSGVGAHGDKTYGIQIQIPPTAVIPNFNGCRLFSCRYLLTTNAELPGCHTDLDIVTDVGLGHIPYPEAPSTGSQNETAPPYSVSQSLTDSPEPSFGVPVPMHMPMPGSVPMPMPPYPPMPMPPYLPPGPSAPREHGAPSAPPKIDLHGNNINSGTRNPALESPPPSYEEASKLFD